MKNKTVLFFTFIGFLLINISCNQSKKNEERPITNTISKPKVISPVFSADSAYYWIEKQVAFGPRVPNTQAHTNCAQFLVSELKRMGLEVIEQKTQLKAFNGTMLNAVNIIGQYQAEQKKRVLLCAHWDSRPFSDRDPKEKNKAIDGANDGASGVAVLLEIARALKNTPTDLGVDIIFFDAEDYGQPNASPYAPDSDSWCLGSQYWSKHPHNKGYFAKFGVLLDMVGGKNAVFPKEHHSTVYAKKYVDLIWETAAALGYNNYFVNDQELYGITDDHYYLNTKANIPSVDIIHYRVGDRDFFPHHHRLTDNMDQIDRNTLKAVGQTLLEVLYNGNF